MSPLPLEDRKQLSDAQAGVALREDARQVREDRIDGHDESGHRPRVPREGGKERGDLGEVRGLNSHSVWQTDDGVFAVTAEERGGGGLRLYEIVDRGGGSLDLVQRDSWVNPSLGPGETYSAHNPVLFEDRVYVSNYQAGALALEIDETTQTWEKTASYDTSTQSPSGFSGGWGVYPRDGHDLTRRSLPVDHPAGAWSASGPRTCASTAPASSAAVSRSSVTTTSAPAR